MGCCSITSPGFSCSERKGYPAIRRDTLSHLIGLLTGLFTQILHDNSYLCTGGRALRVKTVARFAAQQTSTLVPVAVRKLSMITAACSRAMSAFGLKCEASTPETILLAAAQLTYAL